MGFRDYTEIVFESGGILSAQMLEETYRYPREFLRLSHIGYGNGIVAGLDFEAKADGVYLTAGIVKFDGKCYILPQNVNLDIWLKHHDPALTSSAEYFLCLACKDVLSPKEQAGGIEVHHQMVLRAEKEMSSGSLLLAKYKFRPDMGIRLPNIEMTNEKNPFEKFFQSGLLQILECDYAHPQGETTFHPLVFRAVKDYLEQKEALSPYDFSLLTELQNHGIVAIKSLMAYVAANKKVSLTSSNVTREKLLQEVVECIQKPYIPLVYQDKMPEQEQPGKPKRHSKLL